MKGFLFDENLPGRVCFVPSLPVTHVSTLGKSPSDSTVWNYAGENSLVVVTKDADFSDRILLSAPPPWVVHLRFGNLRRKDFHRFLEKQWPQVEALLPLHKLVNVYLDRVEAAL